ncbi:transporter substrate-binding domain-containing protein [Azospirillum endophyticum]
MNVPVLRRGAAALLAATTLALTVAPVSAGVVLDKIKDQGNVLLCTNVNNPPFAFLSPAGEVQGLQKGLFEEVRAGLSKAVAKEVKLEIVPVLPSNRIQFLQQGKCDLIFALTATPERRKVVKFVDPGYYAVGPALVTRKDFTLAKWEDLKGKSICSNTGSGWNPPLEQKYGATVLAFQTQQEVDQSLRDGRCVGLVSDDAFQQSRFRNDKEGYWKDYRIQELAPYSEALPSALAINFGDAELDTLLSGLVKGWHRDGRVIELARQWGLTPPPVIDELRTSLQ